MTRTLFDFDYHVMPGDVLLLRSSVFKATANRVAQRTLRPRKAANFTHVALVISQTHIADAMLGAGVRVRPWTDIAAGYAHEECVVARHKGLATLLYDPAPLLKSVQYYYAQRYALQSLSKTEAAHDAGIVCSQFVALVLQRMGVPAPVILAMRSLPSDIDAMTANQGGWRQFPYTSYGLHTSSIRPAAGDDYWDILEAHLHKCIEVNGFDLNEMSKSHMEKCMDTLVESMVATEEVLRKLAQTDRTILKLAKAVLNVTRPLSDAEQADLSELADEMSFLTTVSMEDLLDEWRRLYVERPTATPKVLADADAPLRLADHQAIFRTTISHLKELASVRNREAEAFETRFASLADLIGQNAPVGKTLISQMHALGTQLLNDAIWLTASTDARIPERSVTYQSLQRGGMNSNEQAAQLVELIELDLMRLKWVSEFEPALKAQTEALASASAALGGS